jgi:hypothetical protein
MTYTEIVKTATTDAIHTLWTQGGNLDDAYDAGGNLLHSLNNRLAFVDAPDLRKEMVDDIVAALPEGFNRDFRFHLLQGFEDTALEEFGLSDDFDPNED